MLLASQIIPFLQHDQQNVRELALRYLAEAHEASPATAEDLWSAIDRFGGGEFSQFYVALSSLPQSEQSITRTLKALETEKGQNLQHHLENVLAELAFGLLMRFRDVVEQSPALSPELRKHLEQRIALAPTPPAELWELLVQFSQQMSNDDWPADEKLDDPRHVRRLIEALGRHPESAQWAITTLDDPTIIDWREVYAVDLLGWMRHRQSAELLVDKLMSDEEADALIESSVDALVRIGSVDVVRLIRDRFGRMSWGIRLHAADVLGRIKLPQSESAACTLLGRETDRTVRTNLAYALCVLGATEPASLEKLRSIINDGTWDRSMTDLDADVVALFTMVGHDVPELPTWRAQAADQEARRAARIKQMKKFLGGSSTAIKHGEELMAPEWDEDVPPWEAQKQTVQQSEFTAPKTYRRETPKVGRNDPCPCGSGKKYKKCCGR